jgi:DcuC family C4-dicarboxylate transporter
MPIICVLITVFITAKLILKGYKTEFILLASGLFLMALTSLFGWGEVLPNNVKSTNVVIFDLFRYIQWLMGLRAGQLGLMIMALVGFAEYMSFIGADKVIVQQAIRPLSKVNNKHLLVFLAYIMGASLQLAIPSATALAVLLMVTLFPIMIGLGISRGTSAAVIASTLATTFTPIGVDAIRASAALNIDLMNYVINYQAPTSIVATLTIGVSHMFWQKHMDAKGGISTDNSQLMQNKQEIGEEAPGVYVILPLLPIIFSVVFSGLAISFVKLDVTTIVLISMAIAMTFEKFRGRSLKEISDGFNVFMKGMGNAFTTVVFLLVSAGVFAYGIQSTGSIDLMVEGAKAAGMPYVLLTLLFCVVVGVASVVMGSGNAAFLSFVEIIPSVASSFGVNPASMMLPVQQVSAMGRAASPVAACVIVSASGAKLSVFEIVKRTAPPVSIGFIVHFIAVLAFV